MLKKIAVLTSGGDAPGMNAAIRGVVRAGLISGLEVYGVRNGFMGLYNNDFIKLERSSVSDVINRGGTFLGSARFPEFRQPEYRKKAVHNLLAKDINGLIVIGGDGSYMGAQLLADEYAIQCVGIPGTIDNDIAGTDYTIGFHTALGTIIDAIDRLRDTSTSHQRISIVEIMGRECGDLTLAAGIAGGCEYIIVPEMPFDKRNLIEQIKRGIEKGKRHAIVAITEHICDVRKLAEEIELEVKRETRATILGHIQRGGSPSPYDRILGSRMGVRAVELILEGESEICLGIQNNQIVKTNILDAIKHKKREFRKELYDLSLKLY